MIEAFFLAMPLWQKLVLYGALLVGLFIFVKTGKVAIFGHQLIPMKWRITLAVFFPIIVVLGIIFGALILGLLVALLAVGTVMALVTGKKPHMPKIPKLRVRVIRKPN